MTQLSARTFRYFMKIFPMIRRCHELLLVSKSTQNVLTQGKDVLVRKEKKKTISCVNMIRDSLSEQGGESYPWRNF